MNGFTRTYSIAAVAGAVLIASGSGLVVRVHAGQREALDRTDPVLSAPAEYQGGEITIQAKERPTGPVLIFKKTGTAPELVGLPDDIVSVDGIRRVPNDLGVVVGRVAASGQEGVIYSLAEPKIMDEFLGYQLTMSPDGHYIAFTRFFPAHFVTTEQASNYLMLYDLRRTARGNRPLGVNIHDMIDAGSQLYPVSKPQDALDPAAPPRPTHVFAEDQFFWSPDSSKLVLLDEEMPVITASVKQPTRNLHLPPRPILSLVLVQVGSGGVAPTVSVAPTGVCATESGSSCYLRLVDVTFGASGVTAQLQGFLTKAAVHQTVALSYDRFTRIK